MSRWNPILLHEIHVSGIFRENAKSLRGNTKALRSIAKVIFSQSVGKQIIAISRRMFARERKDLCLWRGHALAKKNSQDIWYRCTILWNRNLIIPACWIVRCLFYYIYCRSINLHTNTCFTVCNDVIDRFAWKQPNVARH